MVLPKSVESILNRTALGATSQADEMGYLVDKITPEQFQAFLIEFCAGITHVYEEFGTAPKEIRIDDGDGSPRNFTYDADSESIIIYRDAIDYFCSADEKSMNCYRVSEQDTKLVTKTEFVIMCGIEEAYHHYQLTEHADKYPVSGSSNLTGDDYINHPVERDAHQYVASSIEKFGFNGAYHIDVPNVPLKYSSFESCGINTSLEQESLENCPVTQWHMLAAKNCR